MPVLVPQAQKHDALGPAMSIASSIPGPQQSYAQGASTVMSLAKKNPSEAPLVQANTGAMQRRLQDLDQLRQSETAVAQLPQQQQQQYGPAIKRARMMAEQEAYA